MTRTKFCIELEGLEGFFMQMDFDEDQGSLYLRQGKLTMARKYYEEKLCAVISEFGKDHSQCLNTMEKLAFTLTSMGNYLEAKKLFEELVTKREKVFRDSHPDCLRIHMSISFLLNKMGNKSEAEILYRKLKRIADKIDKNDVQFGQSFLLIAISYLSLCKTTEAERLFKELQEKQAKYFWNGHPLSLLIKIAMGHGLFVAENYTECINYHQDTLKTYCHLCKKEYSLYFQCKMDIAVSYFLLNKFSEAEIQLENILRENTAKFGILNSSRLSILSVTAKCCMKQHKFREAKILLKEVLKVQIEMYGKDSLDTFNTSVEIGEILISMRDFAEAKRFLKELLNNVAMVCGENNLLYLKVLRLTSNLKFEMCEYEGATTILEEVLLKQLDVDGKFHPEYIESKKILALRYFKLEKFAETLLVFEDILRLQSIKLGADHQECITAKMFIAAMYLKMKKFHEPVELLKEIQKVQHDKLAEDSEDAVYVMGLLGVAMIGLGKREEGVPVFENFLKKMKFSLSKFDLLLCIAHELKVLGELEYYKSILENAYKAAMEIFGNDHLTTLECQINIAKCLLSLNKPAEAKMMFKKAHIQLLRVYSRSHPVSLMAQIGIAVAMRKMCANEQAVILLKEVLKNCEDDKAILDSKIEAQILLAELFAELGRKTEARLMAEEIRMLRSELDSKVSPFYAAVTLDLAFLYYGFDDFARTKSLCYELLDMPQSIFGENHPRYFNILEVLGVSLFEVGDFGEAEKVLVEILMKVVKFHGEGHETVQKAEKALFMVQRHINNATLLERL